MFFGGEGVFGRKNWQFSTFSALKLAKMLGNGNFSFLFLQIPKDVKKQRNEHFSSFS